MRQNSFAVTVMLSLERRLEPFSSLCILVLLLAAFLGQAEKKNKIARFTPTYYKKFFFLHF
jgi:hypothetical protein